MSLNTLPRVGAQFRKELKVFWPFMVGGAALITALHTLPVTEGTLAESPYKKELDLATGAEIDYGTHPRFNLGYFEHKKDAQKGHGAAHH